MKVSMALKCTGVSLRPQMQWPSHWPSWVAHHRAHERERVVLEEHLPRLVILFSLKRRMTSGMLVEMGQPFWHMGFLHCRQRFAPSTIRTAMIVPFVRIDINY